MESPQGSADGASSYRTVEGAAQAETEEKKSRFIAHLFHADCEEEALAFLESVRAEHRMARHNVYAYIVKAEGATERIRYSDDGEPQKTAGLPTLQVLQHEGLVDVIMVTTRYFGGTLLGTGGLVRAYTLAAQKAVEAAHIVTISKCVDIVVTVPYPLYEPLVRLAGANGAKTVDTQFTDEVTLTLRMVAGTEAPLLAALTELCRGAEKVSVGAPFDAAF